MKQKKLLFPKKKNLQSKNINIKSFFSECKEIFPIYAKPTSLFSLSQTSSTTTAQPELKLSHAGTLAFSSKPSNGSLSDSGISDGGGSSDYGLSERERRLGALRRLAKQLENALVPGSEAINSITQRLEMAEGELRSLQETCRDLIVRTAAIQQMPADATITAVPDILPPQPPQPANYLPIIGNKSKQPKRSQPK